MTTLRRGTCAIWLVSLAVAATAACDGGPTGAPKPTANPDSASIRARMKPARSNLIGAAAVAAGIPIRKGQGATFTVEIDNGRCEDVAVSGAINETLWSGVGTPMACAGSTAPRTLGPAAADGVLVISLPLTPHQTRVSGSGTLWTVSIDDNPGGMGDGDFDDIVVSIQFDKAPEPVLECTPAPVQRGLEVRCALFMAQSGKLLRRRATGDNFVIDEAPGTTHAAGDTYIWKGPAVANTRVELTFEVNEGPNLVQKRFRSRFSVRPREWPPFQLQAPHITVGIRDPMQPYPANGYLGGAVPNFVPSDFANLPVVEVEEGGPNGGLAYLLDPLPAVPHMIYIHPGLYDSPQFPQDPAQRWHADQNGSPGGTCGQLVFAPLLAQVLRHEGATMDPNSHWGITDEFYRLRRPERRIERLYTQNNPGQLRADVWTEWVAIHETGEHKSKQVNFDQVDRPKIFNGLGCDLDFDLSNK